MKATGIVRRIDDLGRVVIPKEIRRTMRIKEGSPLEIFTDRDGEVIFKKYSPVGELNSFANEYAETLHKTGELNVIITDCDAVIAAAGVPRREFSERHLSDELETIIGSRSLYVKGETDERKYPLSNDNGAENGYYITCAMPILSEGDVLGCVAALAPVSGDPTPVQRSAFADRADPKKSCVEVKLIQTAAAFLGKQLET